MSNDCVVIEDTDLSEDEPGPSRRIQKPSPCRNEALWFQEEYQAPSGQVKDSTISAKDIHLFQDFIWDHPHDRMVPGYGMTPAELACVSADGRRGWLVSSHFFWLSQCLNKQDIHSRCFVFDPLIRKESVDKLLPSSLRTQITTLILVMSVGRHDDGVVFFGTDKMQGDHWAVSVIDMKEGNIFYCDTLGWAAPKNIQSSVIKYTRFAGLVHSQQLTLQMAHEPNDEQHYCTRKCTNYPLQKCSDVCGVVVMVSIAVAALDKRLFRFLMQPLDVKVYLYLREPTDYSAYLRYVLISWMARQHIDISKISLASDFDPYKPLAKINTTCAGIKRKSNRESSPQTVKRFSKGLTSANSQADKVSLCILQNETVGSSASTILDEAVQVAAEKRAEKSYWKDICKELCFNNAVEICRDQALSLSDYHQELKKKSNNPLTCFNMFEKNKGKSDISLEATDLVLVIQTDYQKEMLRTYSRQCVCVDWTRKSEEAGVFFHLITMSVFVEGLYEMPVAWIIFNKNDPGVHNRLFEAVKKNVGDIETDIFVGDTSSVSYKYWLQHFKKPRRKMFSMHQITWVLKERIRSRVEDKVVCDRISEYISVFPFITNKDAFEIFTIAFLQIVKGYSLEFHEYFKTKFLGESQDESWASCYRMIPAASFVPFLKPFSYVLNAVGFFQSGNMERVDVFFHKLLQLMIFLKRKLFIVTSDVKKSSTLKEIQKLHQQPCEDVDFFQSISGEEWCVMASDRNTTFSIQDSGCDSCQCPLRCHSCNICIHKYVCTCADYVLSPRGCKHIHHLCTFNKLNNTLNGDGPSLLKSENGCSSDLKSKVLKEIHKLTVKAQHTDDELKLKSILKSLHKIEKQDL